VRAYPEQIRAFLPRGRSYRVLGTDGFGRSDSREKLRHFFEVNSSFVTVAALHELARQGEIEIKVVTDAIKKFKLDPEKLNPLFA
jgi:pyruvate dehydrogenase E1 component